MASAEKSSNSAPSSNWDAVARSYKRQISLNEKNPIFSAADGLIKVANSVSPFSTPDIAILDVGCGPGTVVNRLFTAHGATMKPERILAVDTSKVMLDQCHASRTENIETRGSHASLWEKVEIDYGDLSDLGATVPKESWTHALCGLCITVPKDTSKTLASIRNVVKPGGIMCCSTWSQAEWIDSLGDAIDTIQPGASERFDDFLPRRWVTPKIATDALEGAGWRDVRAEYADASLITDDMDGLLDMMLQIPVAKGVVDASSEEQVQLIRKTLLDSIKSKQRSNGELKGTVVIAAGRK